MPPDIQSVADPGDPRVADYRDVRERDLVGRRGLFVAEGAVVLGHLLSSPLVSPRSVLVAERRLAGLRDRLESLPRGVPVYAAAQPVIDAIAGFHLHRGILAIGERRTPETAEQLIAALPDRGVLAVAIGIANHDNMGGLFRNAAAFGAKGVLIDGTSCDPLYRKAIRVSVGAALTVPFARIDDAGTILDALDNAGIPALGLTPAGSCELREVTPPARSAIVLGAEGPGLPPALMERMLRVRIAMAPGFDSLNVAATSAIALHHLTAGRWG